MDDYGYENVYNHSWSVDEYGNFLDGDDMYEDSQYRLPDDEYPSDFYTGSGPDGYWFAQETDLLEELQTLLYELQWYLSEQSDNRLNNDDDYEIEYDYYYYH